MKKFTLLVILGLVCNLVFSGNKNDQDDLDRMGTIFNRNKSNGGYGAFSLNYSEINNKDALIMGARGAWIIDHSFAIGLGGYGFVNNVDTDRILDVNNNEEYLAGGYGGLILEPIIAPNLPVHLSVPVLLGIGGVAYVEDYDRWDNWYYDSGKDDVFLVFEPGVELEFNMTRHLRLAASVSYRFTSKIEMENTNPDVLEGYNFGLVFKFGKF